MDAELWRVVNEILPRVLERPEAERAACLRELCDDETVRREVASLLDVDTGLLSKVEGLHDALAADLRDDGAPAIGERLGPYRLLRELGRGGMGVVFLAERADGAFERRVALKVLKRGMDTEDIVRRFRNERQILAHLEHKNIAELYDGGTTEDHRPYFVMEYVEGLPIDRYCDQHQLTVEERLRLFLKVMEAVQVAHQSLVVHRDLKPTNILVGADGEPKLLDFGIAKLLAPQGFLEETQTGRFRPMTPAYASPEQRKGKGITTASDVYSLGVLLYELLTGLRPTEDDAEDAPVRDVPLRPSSRMLEGDVTSLAAHRRSDPRRLRRRLAGDLDKILLMALRKDSDRRYPTVKAFADDLHRHLAGRPVQARRETVLYRFQKFVRRHPREVGLGAFLLVFLLAAGIDRELGQRQVRLERDRAQDVAQVMVRLFELPELVGAGGDPQVLLEALERGRVEIESKLGDQPLLQATLRLQLSESYAQLGLFPEASRLARDALNQRQAHGAGPVELAEARLLLASAAQALGEVEAAGQEIRQALEELDGEEEALPLVRRARLRLARLYVDCGRFEDAEQELLLIQTEGLDEQALGAPYAETWGRCLLGQGRVRESQTVLEQALNVERAREVSAGGSLYRLVSSLGEVDRILGNHRRGEELLLEGLILARQIYGVEHGEAGQAQYRLARLRLDQGRLSEAELAVREALDLWRRHLGDDHHYLAAGYSTLARILWLGGRPAEAVAWVRRARSFGVSDALDASLNLTQAGVLLALGRPSAAEPLAREAWDHRYKVTSDPRYMGLAGVTLVEVLEAVGNEIEAAELRAEVAQYSEALPVGCDGGSEESRLE